MSEYTTLTSYLEALKNDRETLANVDVEAVVDDRLAEMRAKVKAEVEKEIAHDTVVTEAKISAITDAIAIITRPVVADEIAEENDEVSEVISDETY